jgi:Immunity protein 40
MTLPSEYIQILRDSGLSLEALNPGSQEIALDRDAALKALLSLSGSEIPVLGGDVLKKEGVTLQYAYANWHCSRQVSEPQDGYAKRSQQQAIDYVSKFTAVTDFVPLFVFVLDV